MADIYISVIKHQAAFKYQTKKCKPGVVSRLVASDTRDPVIGNFIYSQLN